MHHRHTVLCAALTAALACPAVASAQLPPPPDPIGEVLDPIIDPILDDPTDPVEPVIDAVTDPVVIDPPGVGGTATGGDGGTVVVEVTPPAQPAPNAYGALRVLGRRATLAGRRLRLRVACTASARGCTGRVAGRRLRLSGGRVRRMEIRLSRNRARAVRRTGRARILLTHTGHSPRMTTLRVRRRS